MEIGRVEGTTRVLGKSQGYLGLPVRDEPFDCGGVQVPSMVSAWYPTPEELAAIASGAPLHLRILGGSHPPVMLSVGPPPVD